MNSRFTILFKIFSLGLILILIPSCEGKRGNDRILILTEVQGKIKTPDYLSGESWRYLPGARICSIDPDQPNSLKILTKDFHSACFPSISYDGRFMLFSAQKNEGDRWQIWEMNLKNLKYRKITSLNENCADPVYLPGERVVFSKMTINDTVKSVHCLYSCGLDGTDLKEITFSPHSSFATSVLRDGRLLTISTKSLPEKGEPLLTVMRPDGTKAEMFYKADSAYRLLNRAKETTDGKIFFTESSLMNNFDGDLISISYNRPLHSRVNLTSDIDGDFRFILPLRQNQYLVSYSRSDTDNFELYKFYPDKKTLGELVFADPQYNIIDASLAEEYERPRKLPSEVDSQVKTGLLLCQDINFLTSWSRTNVSNPQKASQIEVLGVDSTYGIVQAEDDGSFYLKVMADTPFRIRTIDKNGNTINGPCSWLWLRPNERRGCVGCHEDQELAPENKVSLAIKKSPVIIPVHINKVKEKIVDLE